ncbi:hypothetical protein IP86_18735 [Rhodopseudomonas sp. AAP120]|nr:hypothetical protein IP86_18735 [Rhodopseudomonas sp. AAP120]
MLNWPSQCLLRILMIGDEKRAGSRRRQPSVQGQQKHREEEGASPAEVISCGAAIETLIFAAPSVETSECEAMLFMSRSPSNKEPTTMSWRFSD